MAQVQAGTHVQAERAGSIAKEILAAGVIAGVIGAVLMGMVAMILAATSGQGFWTPMKLIAGVTNGVDVLIGGAGTAIWGMVIHMTVGAAYGALFTLVMPRSTRPTTAIAAGLVYGALVWVFMANLVMPWTNPTMAVRMAMKPVAFFLYHLVFGLGVSLGPALRRRIGGE